MLGRGSLFLGHFQISAVLYCARPFNVPDGHGIGKRRYRGWYEGLAIFHSELEVMSMWES